MSFGNLIGQLLQQGMAGQTQTRGRLQNAASQSGGGLDQMLGSLLGGGGAQGAPSSSGSAAPTSAGVGAGGGFGGLADMAKDFLGNKQAGGMSGAQVGGLGALVGAVLGGGSGATKGALGGGAMAILGTLALTALKNYQGGGTAAAGAPSPAQGVVEPPATPEEVEAMTKPETERLLLKAMIAAAKADGEVDQSEMQRLVGRIDDDGITQEERQFVIDEMTRPLDVQDIASEVRTPAVAAEVYAASILAIDIDTDAERQYLRSLAQALHLDAGTVQRLHQLTGAPTV
jgi:uncharacterized membrane protein YebE (DUF533 family)